MAVFPDRIVLKSSTDPEQDIIAAIEAEGDSEIVPGELVISRLDGGANIYTVDANGDIVSASVPNLSGLLDVDLTEPVADNSILAYDALQGKWVNTVAPPYDISGNDLRDLGDVNLDVNPADGEVLFWNQTDQEWQSQLLTFEGLSNITPPDAYVDGMVPRYNTAPDPDAAGGIQIGWEVVRLGYSDIDNRPTALSDLTNDLNLGDLNDVDLTSVPPEVGDLIAWTGAAWSTVSAPPIDLSGGKLAELGDVTVVSLADGAVPVYNPSNQEYEIQALPYDKIAGRPTSLSNLNNDLVVSDFPNDAGYITNTEGLEMNSLSDVTTSAEQEGQMLIWRSNQWINEFGPPANIAYSSIGELSDVTYYQPGTDPGELTIDNLGVIIFDSPQIGTGFTYELLYSVEYGVGMEAFRDSDKSGSAVYADRSRGVTLRSDVNMVRLTGRPTTTTNRPELRFETGDDGSSSPTGQYIGLKLPETLDESITYIFPSGDGEVGDVLATDGAGNLEWATPAQNTSLGNLSDVDLVTSPPQDGEALIYNAIAQVWLPGPVSDLDLGSSSINSLADVDTSTDPPVDGNTLVWDSSSGNWVPGDSAGAIVWTIAADVNSQNFLFSGNGFLGNDPDPELVVQRGQTYKFVHNAGTMHPFRIQTTPVVGGDLYSNGIDINPLTDGETMTWEVRMDAPDTLYYACGNHSQMGGVIRVGAAGFEDPLTTDGDMIVRSGGQTTRLGIGSEGQVLKVSSVGQPVWANESGGSGGNGGSGAGIYLTETQAASGGAADYVGLGYSGILQKVYSDADAWVTLYSTAAARTADANRPFNTDPTPGSGVLFEAYVTAGGTVVATPGTTYLNNDATLTEAVYAAIRDQAGAPVNASVTFSAYGLAAITAVSGGTFGSGV